MWGLQFTLNTDYSLYWTCEFCKNCLLVANNTERWSVISNTQTAATGIINIDYKYLESFAMNSPVSVLVVLPFGDPHLAECVERGENRTPDPRRVKALLWRWDLSTSIDLYFFKWKLLHAHWALLFLENWTRLNRHAPLCNARYDKVDSGDI